MKKILFTILAILLGTVGSTHAGYEIVILRSSGIKPYEEALHGFRETISAGIPKRGVKSIFYAGIKEFVLAEEPDRAGLRHKILAANPDLILAVGTNAFVFFRNTYVIPIIYLMVPYPQAVIKGHKNITGVNMDISPETQLNGFIETIPGIKRLGLIYNTLRSNSMVESIRVAARRKNIDLIVKETMDSRDVPGLLNGMIGKIDGFWMLPDLTVTTPQTLESMLLFSLENRIPILTFSEKYLIRGATVAIASDNRAMGEQAGEIAKKILAGMEIGTIPPTAPEKVKVMVNDKVAAKLGIIVNHSNSGTE